MKKRRSCILAVVGAIALGEAICAGPASIETTWAADWPAYRNDVGRSSFTSEQLAGTLHRQWTYVPRHAPRPSWPEPVREVHLMPFDYAYQVVAAGGLAYFGSSADHQVHAMDLKTGRQRWSFFTDSPIRFAPQVYGKRLFVASDDGCVYCLSAADGKLLWQFRGGPHDQRLLGNEAMMSRWPLRSGLLVDRDTVYFTAGMWPSEGVYVYALSAQDGTVVWKTEATGGFAPQGYLAAGEKFLVAPAGRSDAWLIERETGKIRSYRGMSQAIVRGDLYFAGPFTHAANENLPITGGLPMATRNRKIVAWRLASDKSLGDFAGKEVAAASHDTIYLAGEGKIVAHALGNMQQKWEVDHSDVLSLAVAGKALVVGGRSSVALLESSKGETLWSADVDGEVRGLAVADRRLLLSTHTGQIVCFGPERPAGGAAAAASTLGSDGGGSDRAAQAGQILESTKITAGFCLMAGVGDGGLALELARQSDLRIYCAEPDAEKAAAARRRLDDAGLYGARVTVHHVESTALPYPEYFANLIVVDEPSAGPLHYTGEQLRRVMRPCGGTAHLVSAGRSDNGSELRISGDGFTETRLSAGTLKVVRGELPGAGQWTHQYANPGKSAASADRLVRWPLKILWFGKPGPGRMMNRHWRGTAPLCVDGRMFILGQHSIMAVDAYNGRQLWLRELPSLARRVVDIRGGSMAADSQGVYLVTSNICFSLSAQTGELTRVYRLPIARPGFVLSSPQTFELDDLGKVEIRSTAEALTLKLSTADATLANANPAGAPTQGDCWELFFDFRSKGRRNGLYGPGALHVIVVPAIGRRPASWQAGPWSEAPKLELAGGRVEKGSQTTVKIAWAEIEKLAGRRPADFNFGAILNSSHDGAQRTGRTRKFADDSSYRLANCWGNLVVDPRAAGNRPSRQKSIAVKQPESLTWGHLSVSGDVIVGTAVAATDTAAVLARGRDFSSEGHDYTGPQIDKVLGNVGIEGEARHVFALDKNDGRVRWIHTPAGAVPHNGIAQWNNRLYLLDKPSAAKARRLKRRGEPATQKSILRVLDLSTGRQLWHVAEGLEDHNALRLGKGILLATNLRGMAALDANDGKRLWSIQTPQPMHHCSAFVRAPVVAGNWVFDEPRAYDLRTGAIRTGSDGKPWGWGGFRGCGTVSGSEQMLFYRTGSPAFLDVGGGTGQHELPGIRPGCYINIIAAGGLVLIPEASSGCGCKYNFQTTVAMIHRQPKTEAAGP